MATALYVKDVGLEDFEETVVAESERRPVVVDFWAPWCAPCRVLGPMLEKLAEEFRGDFLLAKVDTEANPELAQHFDIRSIPNVKVFKNGSVVDELMGVVPEREVRKFLRRHCSSAAERKYVEGMAAARTAFEAALESDSSHSGALVELGKLAAAAGDTDGAKSLWDRVPDDSSSWERAQSLKRSLEFQIVCTEAGGAEESAARVAAEPDNINFRYAHGCCMAGKGDYLAALEDFLFVVARDKGYRDQAARKAMLTIFALVGERSELAEEYRKRLALVLF